MKRSSPVSDAGAVLPTMTRIADMRKGTPLTVETIVGRLITVFGKAGDRYVLGLFPEGHEAHGQVAIGDVMRVIADSASGGSALVRATCGCRVLLVRSV